VIVRAQGALRHAVNSACLLLAVLTAAAFFPTGHNGLELLAHFRLQLCLVAILMFVAAVFLSCRLGGAIGAAAVVANLWAILASLGPSVIEKSPWRERPIQTAIWANLQERPEALARLAALPAAQDAFAIALTELPPGRLAAVREAFPGFSCTTPLDGPPTRLATIILTRECEAAGVSAFTDPDQAVYAQTERLRLVALHPIPPLSAAMASQRDAAIAAALRLKAPDRATLMLGDFNATPYAQALTPVAAAGFGRARCGGPWTATWRSRFPPLGFHIDHAFLTEGLRLIDCQVGPWLGSDHAPLIVRFQVGG
jgi:endonuclease/exonuclease/phosphatase (EEP) superfamily protein YafD